MMKLYFGEAAPEPMTREWMIAVNLTRYPFCQGITKGFGFVGGFSSYRLANLTGKNPKDVYKVILLTTILAPFLANAAFVFASNTWGLTRLSTISGWAGTSYIDGWANASNAANDPAPPPFTSWLPQAAAGFIAAVALSYLHARFIWFPFEPIGLFLATDQWSILTGMIADGEIGSRSLTIDATDPYYRGTEGNALRIMLSHLEGKDVEYDTLAKRISLS